MSEPKRIWKPNLQALASATAIIVSVAALVVAWDEVHIMRAQQYAAAMPIIRVDLNFDLPKDLPDIDIRLTNDGVGPAFIESGVLKIDGEEVDTYDAFSKKVLPEEFRANKPRIGLANTSGVLAPGKDRAILQLNWQDKSLADDFIKFVYAMSNRGGGKISYEVCYCSIYRECWKTGNLASPHPEQVKSCPAHAELYKTFLGKGE